MSSETYLSEKRKFKNLDEAKVINRVNTQLSQVPSSFFLLLAGGVVGLSVGLAVSQKKKKWANYAGFWIPSALLFGVYNMIVKKKKINQLEHTSLLH